MKRLSRGLGGLLIGGILGCFLLGIITGFFGNTWSVEAGGPWYVVISPVVIPALTGFASASIGGIGKSFVCSLIAVLGYIVVGIVTLIIGAFVQSGWIAFSLAIIFMTILFPLIAFFSVLRFFKRIVF